MPDNVILENYAKKKPEILADTVSKIGDAALQPARLLMDYAVGSAAYDAPALMLKFCEWLRVHPPVQSGISVEKLIEAVREEFLRYKELSENKPLIAMLEGAADHVSVFKVSEESELNGDDEMVEHADKLLAFLLDYNRNEAGFLVDELAMEGTPIPEVYCEVITPVMREIRRKWYLGQLNSGHVYFIGAAFDLIISQLYSYLFAMDKKDEKVVITTLKPDPLDFTARMVSDLFEQAKWKTNYLGVITDYKPAAPVLLEADPDLVILNAPFPVKPQECLGLIKDLKQERPGVKVMISGAVAHAEPDLFLDNGADALFETPDAEVTEIASGLLKS